MYLRMQTDAVTYGLKEVKTSINSDKQILIKNNVSMRFNQKNRDGSNGDIKVKRSTMFASFTTKLH